MQLPDCSLLHGNGQTVFKQKMLLWNWGIIKKIKGLSMSNSIYTWLQHISRKGMDTRVWTLLKTLCRRRWGEGSKSWMSEGIPFRPRANFHDLCASHLWQWNQSCCERTLKSNPQMLAAEAVRYFSDSYTVRPWRLENKEFMRWFLWCIFLTVSQLLIDAIIYPARTGMPPGAGTTASHSPAILFAPV